jgi:spore maturation protein CgeB
MGHDVLDIDAQTFFPKLRMRSSRGALHFLQGRLLCEYNEAILGLAANFLPDMLVAFKGSYVQPETLRILRSKGVRLYNYYPDRVALAEKSFLEEALPEYDCFFDTKREWDNGLKSQNYVRQSVFLPHGYDPEIHRPLRLNQNDCERYGCDVSLIATHAAKKEHAVRELVAYRPNLHLRIWGNLWSTNNQSAQLSQYLAGPALEGNLYSKAIKASKVNLAIMGVRPGIEDKTTTRTYEIPACGGFMLHERTSEVLELYEEGKEIACFSDAKELGDKIDYYLAHPEERVAIAAAGRARCVPAYSYDNRMAEIIRWHQAYSASEAHRLSA